MGAIILIGGDICPIRRNQPLFERGDVHALLADLLPLFEQVDLSIANLECPLVRKASPTAKCGPTLGAPIDCVNGLRAMGIGVVGLANNHIMDHGADGLAATVAALDGQGIGHVGADESLETARTISVFEARGVRVGILAMAEHEFGIATSTRAGVNPLDVIDAVRTIDAHRTEFDYLVVLLHAGNEHYLYPRPQLMKTCRFLVEQGASAVVCQHSHCAGCMEEYLGSPIVYGQGNFLFDYPSASSNWYAGLLLLLEPNGDGRLHWRLIPHVQSCGQPGTHRMPACQAQDFLDGFFARSEAIRDESFVVQQWESFCNQHRRFYLNRIRGNRGYLRRLLGWIRRRGGHGPHEEQRGRLNLIRCESHREALVTILASEANETTRQSGGSHETK